MKEFEGKTAVITGAASGIGKALAERFAKEKMQVVLADIEEEALEKTVENLRQYQHRVIGVKTDVLVEESIKELIRVLKPGGVLALSVPRYLPELICWKLSKEYSQTPGGHVRIFKYKQLKNLGIMNGLKFSSFHWAHGLHSPYWWLQCLLWNSRESSKIIKIYHKFLVWDLMKQPLITRILELILTPFIGKSLVMYFKKPN